MGTARTSLIVPLAEANAGVRTQIDRGNSLLALPLKSHADLEYAKSQRKNWERYTSDLLRRYFDSDQLVLQFGSQGFELIRAGEPLHEQANGFRRLTTHFVQQLESIFERLELFVPSAPPMVLDFQSILPAARALYAASGHDRMFLVEFQRKEDGSSGLSLGQKVYEYFGPSMQFIGAIRSTLADGTKIVHSYLLFGGGSTQFAEYIALSRNAGATIANRRNPPSIESLHTPDLIWQFWVFSVMRSEAGLKPLDASEISDELKTGGVLAVYHFENPYGPTVRALEIAISMAEKHSNAQMENGKGTNPEGGSGEVGKGVRISGIEDPVANSVDGSEAIKVKDQIVAQVTGTVQVRANTTRDQRDKSRYKGTEAVEHVEESSTIWSMFVGKWKKKKTRSGDYDEQTEIEKKSGITAAGSVTVVVVVLVVGLFGWLVYHFLPGGTSTKTENGISPIAKDPGTPAPGMPPDSTQQQADYSLTPNGIPATIESFYNWDKKYDPIPIDRVNFHKKLAGQDVTWVCYIVKIDQVGDSLTVSFSATDDMWAKGAAVFKDTPENQTQVFSHRPGDHVRIHGKFGDVTSMPIINADSILTDVR